MLWKPTNSSQASGSDAIPELSHHPARLIEEFSKSLENEAQLELSYYKYHPQSLLDERRKVKIKAKSLCTSKVKDLLDNLRHDEELAFHSHVFTGARSKFHLPLIDFSGRLDLKSLEILQGAIGTRPFESLALYDSGRSFHGYIMRPMSEREWVRFMGTMLLANLPNQPPVVDSRWIGHRLRAGYASLRWSKNTGHYRSVPSYVPIEAIGACGGK